MVLLFICLFNRTSTGMGTHLRTQSKYKKHTHTLTSTLTNRHAICRCVEQHHSTIRSVPFNYFERTYPTTRFLNCSSPCRHTSTSQFAPRNLLLSSGMRANNPFLTVFTLARGTWKVLMLRSSLPGAAKGNCDRRNEESMA